MLDYAANGQYYWTKDELRGMAEETASRLKHAPLEQALQELGVTDSAEKFFERFESKLKEGEVQNCLFS